MPCSYPHSHPGCPNHHNDMIQFPVYQAHVKGKCKCSVS